MDNGAQHWDMNTDNSCSFVQFVHMNKTRPPGPVPVLTSHIPASFLTNASSSRCGH